MSRLLSRCYRVSSRNLLIRETNDDEIETVVYKPTGSTTDSDDEVRVSSPIRCR